jgi:hypothetical protein
MRRRRGPAILRRRFLEVCGYPLDEEHPQTFTEHLYCRMIEQHTSPDPRMTALADKLLAREYVAEKVGSTHSPRLLWHGKEPTRIPFDHLPDRYVLKPNHGSGQVIRVDGEADRDEIVRVLDGWLRRSWYWASREHHYLGIQPCVLAEEWLVDDYADGPLDYRFYCFHGRPALVQVSDHSHVVHRFFDLDWRPLAITCRPERGTYPVQRPVSLEEMVDVARRLSEGFDFIRVDLFNVSGRVLVGELTFTPNAGYRPFHQLSVERELGQLWAGASDMASLPYA